MPSRLPSMCGTIKAGPLPSGGVLVPALVGTTSPSDSLPARDRFALGLSAPPSPDVGSRGGSLLFRVRPSSHALPNTPGTSCASPDPSASTASPHAATTIHAAPTGAVSCLRREMGGSAIPPFRGHLSRGLRASRIRIGPATSLPSAAGDTAVRAFDAPLGRRDLSLRLGPATRRTGAYRGGTPTRGSNTADGAQESGAFVRTHHW